MRDDMSKVLVESPRSGRALARSLEGGRRLRRNLLDRDGDGAPQRVGMRRDAIARKHFGEHLGPLFRYLRQQIHRPWVKVYGELCAELDRRNVVQAHLFEHISDQVALDTIWLDGQVWVRTWIGLQPVAKSRVEMFVHPNTGILLPNRARVIAAQRKRRERAAKTAAPHPHRRIGLPGMVADCQLHRIDGIWYEVKLGVLDVGDDKSMVYDVVLKRLVTDCDLELLRTNYARPGCYGIAKRQLSHKALCAHGLVSQSA